MFKHISKHLNALVSSPEIFTKKIFWESLLTSAHKHNVYFLSNGMIHTKRIVDYYVCFDGRYEPVPEQILSIKNGHRIKQFSIFGKPTKTDFNERGMYVLNDLSFTKNIPHCEFLSFENISIGCGLKNLAYLPNVRYFSANNADLTSADLDHIHYKLEDVKYISLKDNLLRDISYLFELNNLEVINVSGNLISTIPYDKLEETNIKN
jgi:hypothetical protein